MAILRAYYVKNVTTNSSVKTFVVPSGFEYWINSVTVVYTTNATVGNRLVKVLALDTDNAEFDPAFAFDTQAASLTRTYNFSPGLTTDSTFASTGLIRTNMPKMVLPSGFTLKVFDSAAIAAAGTGENMLVYVNLLAWKF